MSNKNKNHKKEKFKKYIEKKKKRNLGVPEL